MKENNNGKKDNNLKNILKSKNIILMWLKKTVLIACILLLLAASAWAIIEGIITEIVGVVEKVGSFFMIDSNDNDDIDISNGITMSDENMDTIVDTIEKNGLTLKDIYLSGDVLGLDENSEEYKVAVNKYIRQFWLASVCTSMPDLGITEDETHYNGIIRIKRLSKSASSMDNAKSMEYVEKSKFDTMVKIVNGQTDESVEGYTKEQIVNNIKNMYSIDKNGNLYFVNDVKIENSGYEAEANSYMVTMQSVNYKSVVEKYSMPLRVTIALCEVTQNPQYVYEFIEKYVLSGHIDITIMDNEYTDTYNSWYDYTIKEKNVTFTRENLNDPDSTEKYQFTNWGVDKTEITNIEEKDKYHQTTVTTRTQGTAKITDVDTWMAKLNIEYKNETGITEYPLGEEVKVEDVDLPDGLPKDTTTFASILEKTETTYTKIECKKTETESLVRNKWTEEKNEVDEVAIEKKAKDIIIQWDEIFSIPNTINAKSRPGPMIESGAEILLALLDSESTQKQREIYKYLLYIYTNGKYGDEKLDMSIYENNELKVLSSSDVIVDIRRSSADIILNSSELEKAITECFSGNIQKNLLNNVDAFYNMQKTHKVNATFAIAMTIAESSGGTNWAAIDPSTYNWMSIQGTYNGNYYTASNGTKWRKYPSFAVAVDDFGDLIANGSPYFAGGNYTVREIMKSYNPGGADKESATILKIMSELYKVLGIKFSVGGIGEALDGPNWDNTDAWLDKNIYAPTYIGQCTWFAAGRFYEIFGYEPGFRGDGCLCADQLVAVRGDKFEISDTPAVGAIISTINMNHVAIVVGWDGTTMTIDSGNLDGVNNTFEDAKSDWMRVTWTIDELIAKWGPVKFAVPK